MFSATVPTQRFLAGSLSALPTVILAGAEGEPTSASSAVVANVFRSDGTVALTSQSASLVAGTVADYRFTLTTDMTNLDMLTVDWYEGAVKRTSTNVEIVGGFYFSVAEARAADPTIADDAKYPDATIRAARTAVEWEAERIMGVSWVPRWARVTVDRPPDGPVLLPDPMVRGICSVTAYTSPTTTPSIYSGSDLADLGATRYGQAAGRSGAWSWATISAPYQSITVCYEHGFDAPAPDVKDAAILHLRAKLHRKLAALSDRATTQTNEFGTVQLATAGRDGFETGIPDVDAVYARHMYRTPGIG